jgi:hypothetical protein
MAAPTAFQTCAPFVVFRDLKFGSVSFADEVAHVFFGTSLHGDRESSPGKYTRTFSLLSSSAVRAAFLCSSFCRTSSSVYSRAKK